MAIKTTYTLDELYNIFKNKFNELSTKVTFFGGGSILNAIGRVMAFFTHLLQLQVNIAHASFYTKSARATHLDNRANDWDVQRKQQTATVLVQEFQGDGSRTSDIDIPINFEVTTDENVFGEVITYRLLEETTLVSGDASVTGYVECTKLGTVGNVASGVVILMPTEIAGITGTANIEESVNGSRLERDDEMRTRIKDKIVGLSQGNTASVESAIREIEGIRTVRISENSPTNGTFTVYVSSDSGIIDSVLLIRINEAIKRVKDICISYSVLVPTVQYYDIAFNLKIDTENFEQVALVNKIKNDLVDYINTQTANVLYRSDLIVFIKKNDGVINVTDMTIGGSEQDIVLSDVYIINVNNASNIAVTVV